MKAGRWIAFIVAMCLESVMKHEARDMSSLMKQEEILQRHAFSNRTMMNYAVLHFALYMKYLVKIKVSSQLKNLFYLR